jgi:hypothetical protein
MAVFVYLHMKKNSNDIKDIFYVGKGTLNRANNLISGRNYYHNSIVVDLKGQVTIKKLKCLNEGHALKLEWEIITKLDAMGVKLANIDYITSRKDDFFDYHGVHEVNDSNKSILNFLNKTFVAGQSLSQSYVTFWLNRFKEDAQKKIDKEALIKKRNQEHEEWRKANEERNRIYCESAEFKGFQKKIIKQSASIEKQRIRTKKERARKLKYKMRRIEKQKQDFKNRVNRTLSLKQQSVFDLVSA